MKYRSPVFCEHANECPTSICQCPDDCACRESMCSAEPIAEQESQELAEFVRDLKSSVRAISLSGPVNRLISAVEAVYPYLIDERVAELKAAIASVKGATRS